MEAFDLSSKQNDSSLGEIREPGKRHRIESDTFALFKLPASATSGDSYPFALRAYANPPLLTRQALATLHAASMEMIEQLEAGEPFSYA